MFIQITVKKGPLVLITQLITWTQRWDLTIVYVRCHFSRLLCPAVDLVLNSSYVPSAAVRECLSPPRPQDPSPALGSNLSHGGQGGAPPFMGGRGVLLPDSCPVVRAGMGGQEGVNHPPPPNLGLLETTLSHPRATSLLLNLQPITIFCWV